MPKQVTIQAEGISIMRGVLGESNQKKAVKVDQILHHPAYQERTIDNVKEWYNE